MGPDGHPGQWYLHLFAPEQPDLNWDDPEVREDCDPVLRFWLDRGVDGIRVDAAPAMAKVPDLPDAGHHVGALFEAGAWVDKPHWDVEEVHDILRRWRKIADQYDGERMIVAEAVVNGPDRLARYLRSDEMHTAFNFDYLKSPWDAAHLRRVINHTLATLGSVGAPPTWVLSSHDETRHLTRFGRAHSGASTMGFDVAGVATNPELGTRRAPAAALLTLALPGAAYATPPGNDRGGPPEAATDAEFPCPGAATAPPSVSQVRGHGPGCPSPTTGAT